MKPTLVTAAVIMDFEGRILLGKRKDSGLYGPPGGKLDDGELLKAGCARELYEESGIRVEQHDLIELGFCERTDKHQLVFWYWATLYRGMARNMEPEKCEGWKFMEVPADEECIPGLRLFKYKLMGVLRNVSGIPAKMVA